MNKQIGKRIKGLRVEKGLTQEKLGKQLGLDRTTIGKIERGIISLTSKVLIELKRIFKVTTDWILTGEESFKQIEVDDDLMEMIYDLKNNYTVKFQVLRFFYNYKANNLTQFLHAENQLLKKNER